MVFKARNISKRAPKIYKAVFVEGRMPKGDNQLPEEAYAQLKKWVLTEIDQ